MRRWFLLLIALAACSASARAQDNSYCVPLKAFRDAPFAKDAAGNPVRRTVEIHWIGNWLSEKGWHIECRNGATEAGKALCAALSGNVNSEFTQHLPLDILDCFGWSVPQPWNDYDLSQFRVPLNNDEHGKEREDRDRKMFLETDMRPRKVERHEAIRLSVIPLGEVRPLTDPIFAVQDAANPVADDR